MLNYWLFQVMDEWFRTLWQTLLVRRVAAQHYPRDCHKDRQRAKDGRLLGDTVWRPNQNRGNRARPLG
jgi:hypothetical protein